MSYLVLFPNQLFPISFLKDNMRDIRHIVMWEDPVFFGDRNGSAHVYAQQLNLNPLRVEYQALSTKHYVDTLKAAGWHVSHYTYSHIKRISNPYISILKSIGTFYVFDHMDNLLWTLLKTNKIDFHILDSPSFILSRQDIDDYIQTLKNPKKLRHSHFFTYVKHKLGVLEGVKNQDKENRKPFPKSGVSLPKVPTPFSRTKPCAKDFPMTHASANQWFKVFLRERLSQFGKYEDAVVKESQLLYHSGISMYLNNGLLLPKMVVKETLAYAKHHDIPIASLEGFLRQIIGWREFCRLYYVQISPNVYRKNKFLKEYGKGSTVTKIDKSWYNGTTGVPVVDNAITDAFKYGYLHHIRRLMIMANYMTLCKLHPDLIYKWMYEFSLDSWDWVMVFNCYSMGSYSDGGVATWKPYISSTAYIKRMARERGGDWEHEWNNKYNTFKKS